MATTTQNMTVTKGTLKSEVFEFATGDYSKFRFQVNNLDGSVPLLLDGTDENNNWQVEITDLDCTVTIQDSDTLKFDVGTINYMLSCLNSTSGEWEKLFAGNITVSAAGGGSETIKVYTEGRVGRVNVPISEVPAGLDYDFIKDSLGVLYLNTSDGYVPVNPIIDVTFEQLSDLIENDNLTIGQKYRITDFCTMHIIPNTENVNTGNIEPLIVTANSTSTLESIAKSELYPSDVIYYDVTGTKLTENLRAENNKGFIYRRIDTILNNDFCFDFRNVKFRRWKISSTKIHDTGVGLTVTKGEVYKKTDNNFDLYVAIRDTEDASAFTDENGDWFVLGMYNKYLSPYPTSWEVLATDISLIFECTSDYIDVPIFISNLSGTGVNSYSASIQNNIFNFLQFENDMMNTVFVFSSGNINNNTFNLSSSNIGSTNNNNIIENNIIVSNSNIFNDANYNKASLSGIFFSVNRCIGGYTGVYNTLSNINAYFSDCFIDSATDITNLNLTVCVLTSIKDCFAYKEIPLGGLDEDTNYSTSNTKIFITKSDGNNAFLEVDDTNEIIVTSVS